MQVSQPEPSGGRVRVALVVTGIAVIALSGCTSDASQAPRAGSTAPVIAPGRPGEEARTLSPEEAATAVPQASANAADITYMQDMILHHRQALDMAILAPNRAEPALPKSPAARLQGRQRPEHAW